jgi:hypothetical protein
MAIDAEGNIYLADEDRSALPADRKGRSLPAP